MKKLLVTSMFLSVISLQISAQEISTIKPNPISLILYPEIFEIYAVENQADKEQESFNQELNNMGLVVLNYEGLNFLVRIYDDATDYALHKVSIKPLLEESIESLKVEKLGSFGWEYLPDPWKYEILAKR